jgi:hypothetical protein
MAARVLFPVLACGGNAIIPPAPGDHQGPPHIHPTTLAPTEFDGLFLAYLCTTQPWWSYTCSRIRQYFPYLEVLYRSSQDKKTVCHYRSKSMWYTNLCKLHWTVSKICVTLVFGPKFYVNYVSFSAYLREQPTSFPLNTSLGALA